jgi:hypothetical protein
MDGHTFLGWIEPIIGVPLMLVVLAFHGASKLGRRRGGFGSKFHLVTVVEGKSRLNRAPLPKPVPLTQFRATPRLRRPNTAG